MITPLFPLNSVILPGGRIPLRIFERRYLNMLPRCLREEQGFVMVLLQEQGPDTKPEAAFHPIGCYVRVVDFEPMSHGLLSIVVEGVFKTSVVSHWREADGLNMGEVIRLPDEPLVATPPMHEDLITVLQALCQHPSVQDLNLSIDYEDARELGWRLTELLPLEVSDRQTLLEMDDPLERLEMLEGLIESME